MDLPASAASALLQALAHHGDAAALVDGETVIAQAGPTGALGDLAELARLALAEPRFIEPAAGPCFEVRAFALGRLTAIVARDVTEREELRRAARRSDEILAVGSNELKGPLHVIGMSCQLIQARAERSEPIDRSTLDRLARQVTRLDRLIGELLDASRLQEGRLVLDLEELDLVQLIHEAVASTSSTRPLDLSLSMPERAPVRGDRQRLGGACFQLLDNAFRFTAAGTPIDVTLTEEPGAFCLRIVDSGPGVPADVVRQLFRRPPRREPEGPRSPLRLGLFIAAGTVRLHHGTLEYHTGPTGGAIFTMRLPRV